MGFILNKNWAVLGMVLTLRCSMREALFVAQRIDYHYICAGSQFNQFKIEAQFRNSKLSRTHISMPFYLMR